MNIEQKWASKKNKDKEILRNKENKSVFEFEQAAAL